jgi:hypothetical protein
MHAVLPEGPDNARSPFRLLECDSPGGDVSKIPAENSGVRNLTTFPRKLIASSQHPLYWCVV